MPRPKRVTPGAGSGQDSSSPRLVVGLQPVRELLRFQGPRLGRVLIEDRDTPRLDSLERYARDQGATEVRRVSRGHLDSLAKGLEHQGVLAFAPPLALYAWNELLEGQFPLVLALDSIQDPQNFGAVVRSAVAIAGAPVLFAEHASAPLTAATFRASAGAIEQAVLCRVPSLRAALLEAKQAGWAIVGLDPQGAEPILMTGWEPKVLLVLGNEHRGLRPSVRELCTRRVRLLSSGRLDSLNASVACGIALHCAVSHRQSTE